MGRIRSCRSRSLRTRPASPEHAGSSLTAGQWGREHLVDDAALCVTEQAANSALHSGSPYLRVRLRDIEPGVRLSVEDAGGIVPLAALAPPPVASQGTTGRGLAIVSVLAKAWGIEEHADGRGVWVNLLAMASSTTYDRRWWSTANARHRSRASCPTAGRR